MGRRSLQFGQEYTGRNELLLTMPLTQDDVQELMTTLGDSGDDFV